MTNWSHFDHITPNIGQQAPNLDNCVYKILHPKDLFRGIFLFLEMRLRMRLYLKNNRLRQRLRLIFFQYEAHAQAVLRAWLLSAELTIARPFGASKIFNLSCFLSLRFGSFQTVVTPDWGEAPVGITVKNPRRLLKTSAFADCPSGKNFRANCPCVEDTRYNNAAHFGSHGSPGDAFCPAL